MSAQTPSSPNSDLELYFVYEDESKLVDNVFLITRVPEMENFNCRMQYGPLFKSVKIIFECSGGLHIVATKPREDPQNPGRLLAKTGHIFIPEHNIISVGVDIKDEPDKSG